MVVVVVVFFPVLTKHLQKIEKERRVEKMQTGQRSGQAGAREEAAV